jgi:hypothetical protein
MATWTERAASFLFGRTLKEASYDGGEIDPDDYLYRRVTDDKRDLNPITHQRAIEISRALWQRNPMAKRLIEIVLDMVLGDGLTLNAEDEDVQEIITEFWEDPVMRLDLRFRDLMRDLSIEGELVLRAYEGNAGGRVRLGYIDPDRIKQVLKDPDNMFVDDKIVLNPKEIGGPDEELQCVRLEVIGGSHEYTGDTFFYAINRSVAGHRGNPDLLALADWIDAHDQILFNALDRTGLQNAFVWDVLLMGADETQIGEWITKHGSAPRPGSVRVHNDSEKWEAIAPQLGAAELETVARMVKNLVLGGHGLPEAWFAEGDSANRATLAEQGTPTFRMIVARQKAVKYIVEDILQYVIEKAVEASRLSKTVNRTVSVDLTEPSSDDVTEMVTALPQLVNAMMGAIGEELISRESARTVFLQLVNGLGIEFDPESEVDKIEDEKEAEEAKAEEERKAAMALGLRPSLPGAAAIQPNQPVAPAANGKEPAPVAAAK